MSALRVGIAGYGVVGKIRRRHIDAHPVLRVVALCDRDFSTSHRAEDGVECASTYNELLAHELDVLFVCLPNYLAAEATIAGLEAGLHVFCEKPPARTVDEVIEVRACERNHPGQKLMYGFNHRYHPSVREALRIIEGGEMGPVIDLRGVYGKSRMIRYDQDTDWRVERAAAGGGILLDQGIHIVDMMRLFAGDFTEVYSFVSNSYWHHDVEDNAYALMRTATGIPALLHSSATQWRHRFSLDVTLRDGAILLSGILSSTKSYGAETITVVHKGPNDGGDPLEQTTRYNEDVSWEAEIDAFANAITTDTSIKDGSSLEALKTMELVYRIYAADEEWAKRWNLESPDTASIRG